MKVAQKLDFFNFSYYIIMYNENKKIKKGDEKWKK